MLRRYPVEILLVLVILGLPLAVSCTQKNRYLAAGSGHEHSIEGCCRYEHKDECDKRW